MQETFHHYHLARELTKKHSHRAYLASPINPQRGHGESEGQVVLTVFASSLFCSPHESESLLKKAQRIKALQHPHLAPILDMGIEQEQPFVVRKYMPNGSLRSYIKQLAPGHLELRDALKIVLQIGEALAYAHEHNIVHGNLKPENILFDASGRPVLADFYLVDGKGAIIRDQATEEYAFCYLAPEQFAGTCSVRGDQYALGCLTYELITGRSPFAVRSLVSMIGQSSNTLPAPLSESVADLSPSLEFAVLKTLSRDPAERFFDLSLFLYAIKSFLSPSPAFPFAHTVPSHGNRISSYSTSRSQERSGTSPSVSQSRERSGASPSPRANADMAEPGVTPLTSQASMREWTGVLPVSQSLEVALVLHQFSSSTSQDIHLLGEREHTSPLDLLQEQKDEDSSALTFEAIPLAESPTTEPAIAVPIIEQDPDDDFEAIPLAESPTVEPAVAMPLIEQDLDDALLTNLFEEGKGEGERLSEGEDASSAGGHRAPAGTMGSSFVKGTQRYEPMSVFAQHSRRRGLELGLILSVIMAVVCSALWLSGRVTPEPHLHMPNPSLRIAKKTMQVLATQTASKSIVQSAVQPSSVQTTAIATTRPSARATLIPVLVTQPVGDVNSVLAVQPPSPALAPAPAPTPTTPQSYEAEASQNTLTGDATVIGCGVGVCSGGYRVGYIGFNTSNQEIGTLQFNNVNEGISGNYTLNIYYLVAGSDTLTGDISTNGESAITVNYASTTNGDTIGTASITVSLNAGNNTIEFSNPSAFAPDIDRIVV